MPLPSKLTVSCFLCGVGALLLAGCQDEGVQHYRVAKPETFPAPKPKVRLLAAIFPAGDSTWFFKLSGPTQAVDDSEKAFRDFVASIRFTDKENEPVTWALPEGWKQGPPSPNRYATITFTAGEHPLELTVVRLGKEAGSLLANVNRWRGQIGLKAIGETDLGTVTKPQEINGVQATLVDMAGPGAAKGPMVR